ncbi:MAG: hypothetical protein HQL32_07850 [Planctomycetes bacterium]|nr:hypothetical protein [Planctomycetota bacterium]
MNVDRINHPLRVLGIFALSLFLLDLAFALFAWSSLSLSLLTLTLWDLASLPLWLSALAELFLQKKSLLEENRISSKPESAQLFDQSYESVLLKRQIHFTRKRLHPLLSLLSLILFALLAIQLQRGQLPESMAEFSSATQAGLYLFRACCTYILSRYLLGLSLPLKQGHVSVLGGLGLYQSLLALTLMCLALSHNDSFLFIHDYLFYIPQIIIAFYLLEVLARSLASLYKIDQAELPPSCPIIARMHLGATLKSAGKEAVSYQFGYDFQSNIQDLLGKKIVLWTLSGLFFFALGSCVGVVNQGYVAFISTLGKVSEPVGPGLYFKAPWPIANIQFLNKGKMHRIAIGEPEDSHSLLWQEEDHNPDDEFFLVRDSQNNTTGLALERYAFNAVLNYEIDNAYQYLFLHKKPKDLIEKEMFRVLSLESLDTKRQVLLSVAKYDFEQNLQAKLQARLNELKLGVRVTHLGLPQIHPPSSTIEAFNQTVNSRFQKSIAILESQAKASSLVNQIEAESHSQIEQAKAKAAQIKSLALGDLNYFQKAAAAIKPHSRIYLERKRLEALNAKSQDMKKVLILNQTDSHLQQLNLEEALDTDLLERSLQARE